MVPFVPRPGAGEVGKAGHHIILSVGYIVCGGTVFMLCVYVCGFVCLVRCARVCMCTVLWCVFLGLCGVVRVFSMLLDQVSAWW